MTTTSPKSTRTEVQPTRSQARFAFTILLLINILNYTDRYILSAILPKLKLELGLSNVQSGLLGSSFLLIYGLATLPLGVWADKGPRKNIVAICVAIWSVATTLAGFARDFSHLFIARAVLGVGEAGYAPASLSLLGDFFHKGQRGRVISFWSAGQLIGAAFGFTLGGLIADSLGWRWAFYLVGIPGLLMAFLAWRTHEPIRGAFENEGEDEDPGEDAAASHGGIGPNFWQTALHILRIPTYLSILGALIFSFFTIGATSYWLPEFLVKDFHITTTQAGLYSGAVLVSSGLIGTLLGGWLADRAQKKRPQGRLIVASLGLLIGAPLVLIALLLHNLAGFIAVVIVAVTFLNFCVGPLNAVIQDIITPNVRSTALGLSLLLAHLLGDAASPTVVGVLADRSSLNMALLVTAPTCLFLAGLICLLGIRTVAQDMHNMQVQRKQIQAS